MTTTSELSMSATASRPTRRLLIVTLAVWLVLTFAIPLAALTLNAVTLAGFPLGVWMTAQGVLGALAALAIWFAYRARGVPAGDRPTQPMTFAGEAIGAAGVLGFTGAIASLGYDGLALPLGLTAGLALLAIFIAPRFVLYPVSSVSGFFAMRYGGVWPRRAGLAVLILVSILLLAADVRGGALALQGLLGTDYASAVAVATVAVAGVWLATSIVQTPQRTGLIYVLLLIGFAIVLVALTVRHGSLPLPYFSYGQAIGDLAALEQKLVIDKLSDVKSLRPMGSPFLQLSMANFAGVVIAMALGIAVLPHLLGRHVTQVVVTPGDAARRSAYATSMVAVFLMGLAAFAVFARLGVADMISKGIENTAIPETLVQASELGWVEICGPSIGRAARAGSAEAPSATSPVIDAVAAPATPASDIAAACAKAAGQRGFLRMQDVAFTSDSFVVAAPLVIGLPRWATLLFWAVGLLAALATGNAIISGLLGALRDGRGGRLQPIAHVDARADNVTRAAMNAIDARTATAAIVLLLLSSMLAVVGSIEIPSLVSEGLAIVAAGLFPAVALGLYWRGMTATGAVAAILCGGGLAAFYVIGVRLFPVAFVEWSGWLANAAPNALRRFELLKEAVTAAPTPEARILANAALQRHAGTIAGWFGLKPAAGVLLALPLGFVAAIVFSMREQRRANPDAGERVT